MAQRIQPGRVGAALRLGVLGGVVSGVLSLADPISGGTLSRAGTGLADATSAGSIAHDLQLALLVAGLIISIAISVLAARQGRSFWLGLLAGIIAGLLGAVLGALINIGASYVATDAEVNYLVALGGDVSLEMGQAGATGTAIFYGIVAVVVGTVQGVVCGLIGGLAGRFVAGRGTSPVHVAM
jgi:hypothetical protein